MTIQLNGTTGITTAGNVVASAGDLISSAGGLNALYTPINNTGASSDLTLSVGQIAYVDYTAATTIPMHIACGNNQLYEVIFENVIPGTTSGYVQFQMNNTTYTGVWSITGLNAPGSGTASGYATTNNAPTITGDGGIMQATSLVNTTTTNKRVLSRSHSIYNGTTYYTDFNSSVCTDTTTPWTSLGTIVYTAVHTGRIWIRRLG